LAASFDRCCEQFLIIMASHYYPASKNPYDDPLKKADMGSTNVAAQERADFSDPALSDAKAEVRDTRDSSWCLFGYVGTSNVLKVVEIGRSSRGNGGLAGLKEELHNGKPMFGFLKVYLDSQTTPRFVYITWNPAGTPPLLRGLMHGRSYDVGRYFEPFHLQMDATAEEDLDEKKMMDRLKKAASK